MIKVILWDIDGTVLDFLAAEKAGIKACFSMFGMGECTDEMVARYSVINTKYWKMLERGEIDKPSLLRGRFEEFFSLEGVSCPDIDAFNAQYQISLGDTIVFRDDAFNLISSLRGKVLQYAVTNGTKRAQEKKLRLSGLIDVLDGAFISDELGCEKPTVEFFNRVFAEIGSYGPDEVVIVGDSLTSDIRGGNNAGILCCWYNPDGAAKPDGLRIDFETDNLQKIPQILGTE